MQNTCVVMLRKDSSVQYSLLQWDVVASMLDSQYLIWLTIYRKNVGKSHRATQELHKMELIKITGRKREYKETWPKGKKEKEKRQNALTSLEDIQEYIYSLTLDQNTKI